VPLPSLYISKGEARVWSVLRAAGYGAAIGALAALFKSFGPLRESSGVFENLLAHLPEVARATLAFALLCAGAAALRNFIAQRLIWPDAR